MRTTLDLDDELMDRLLRRFPGTSKTRAVELAVAGFLQAEAYDGMLELAGAFPAMADVSEENTRLELERLNRLWGS